MTEETIIIKKFRTEDGYVFDNKNDATEHEAECKKQALAENFDKCSYKLEIWPTTLLNLLDLSRHNTQWYLVHPVTEEDIEIIKSYIYIYDNHCDTYGCKYYPDQNLEVGKDYIMVYDSNNMYMFTPESLAEYSRKKIDEDLEYMMDQISDLYFFEKVRTKPDK